MTIYITLALAAFVVAVLNSPLGEEPEASFEPGKFSALDIALPAGEIDRAADVIILDLLLSRLRTNRSAEALSARILYRT